MSTTQESQSTPDTKEKFEEALKETWNLAIERASAVAGRSFHGDDEGTEPMTPSTIAEEILKLKKTG